MHHDSCRRFRFLIPLAVLAFVGLLSLAVFMLWNGVLAAVLPVKVITFWQALGLLVLSKILFGGFPGKRGGCGRRGRDRFLSKQWESATPAQREQMREEMRHRFGDWPRPWDEAKRPEPEDPEKTSRG